MKKVFLILIAAAGLGACLAAGAASPATGNDPAIEKVGVYDSRAVTIAFAGTDRFRSSLKELRKQHALAKEAGDKEQVAILEAEGQARQKELHRQGFSTAPVDNILVHYPEGLAQLKAEHDLDLLISKWDLATLDRYPEVEQVDVTMMIVDLLQPNETQRDFARQILDKDPVPLKKFE